MSDTTGDTLRRAVLADPFDDAPRLIYADWLDEHGDAWDVRYAELIRTEVWLATADKIQGTSGWAAADQAEYQRRLERLEELWWNHPDRWFGPYVGRYDVDRGFLRTIDLSLRTFLEQAEAVFRRHPVTKVLFNDFVRRYVGYEPVLEFWVAARWRGELIEGELIGESLGDLMPGCWPLEFFPGQEGREFRFETYEAAQRFLSDAAVAYGRRVVGLPPLEKASGAP
jgi:uncharacterized protein (TIGR02996 family)